MLAGLLLPETNPLVQTQFPTTSEREEIGRAIGLSARKVQVRAPLSSTKHEVVLMVFRSGSRTNAKSRRRLPTHYNRSLKRNWRPPLHYRS